LYKTLLVGVREVGKILIDRGNPAISDQKPFEIPLHGLILIPSKDGSGDIRDMLARIGFTCDVKL
jgi:hypothetical protein